MLLPESMWSIHSLLQPGSRDCVSPRLTERSQLAQTAYSIVYTATLDGDKQVVVKVSGAWGAGQVRAGGGGVLRIDEAKQWRVRCTRQGGGMEVEGQAAGGNWWRACLVVGLGVWTSAGVAMLQSTSEGREGASMRRSGECELEPLATL